MPEQELNKDINAALNEREIALKERELALKEQEKKAKIELDKRGVWFTSPLIIAAFSAVFGLLGTGIGAALQGYSTIQLERQKFEFSLMQKALEKEQKEASKTLLFLVDSGVIQSLDGAKIRKIAEDPERLPQPNRYVVVIPVDKTSAKDILTTVRQFVPNAVFTSTSEGRFIWAGAFKDLAIATSRASLLRKSGFNATVVRF